MRVLVTRKIPDCFIQQLEAYAEVDMYDESTNPMPRQLFLDKSKQADIVITMLSDQVDKAYLDDNRHLKAVINLAVGTDNIDVVYAQSLGIQVANTPDVLTETTAELAFTLMLVSARRIVEAAQYVQNGQWKGWSPYLLAGVDVYDKTIGIFGMGSIGSAIARRTQGFNMKILYHNRSHSDQAEQLGAQYVDFDTLLEESDFIICAAPLTDETKHVFNKEAFKKMKNSAIFINIGRGAHVVEQDLLHAIQTDEIYAAGLDVLETEPIANDHPFLREPRITVLPHIGSASKDTRDAMIQLCIDNAVLAIRDEPLKTAVK
ncbi:D-glycerate dehydrogenase [Macrococcoides canis]|uniref:2-hydroxyacid dehydrogenase n=1 Tax=Macrococcoides canis TaxID=1855823 RepID=UPI0013E962D8|nr:D-glycerate dehydrogenase [Macrococcus canis]QIH75445.1 D-glycerate dehydrogenase [Macrococcus canis]